MKYLLIISCLLFTSISWSKDVNWNELVERDGLFYEKFTREPFTGNVLGKQQGKISKGVKDGEWIVWYSSGQLNKKENYKDGKSDGEWLWYHDNGQLWKKRNYKDGKQEGEYLYYEYNGQLRVKSNYKDDKREDSEQYVYDVNGELEKTEIFKDDKLIKIIKP